MGKRKNTLRFRILTIISIVCIPILVLLLLMNTYSIQMIQNKIYENNRDMLSMNTKQLDIELWRVSDYLVNECLARDGVSRFASQDETEKYYITTSWMQELAKDRERFNYLEGIMYYSPRNQNRIYTFTEYRESYMSAEKIMKYLIRNSEQCIAESTCWNTYMIDGQNVLIYAVGNEDAMFCAWTTYETLMQPVKNWKMEQDSQFCFTSKEGELYFQNHEGMEDLDYQGSLENYYFSGNNKEYLMTGVESEVADFRMMNATDRKQLLGVFWFIRMCGLGVFMIFIMVLIPLLIHYMNKYMFRPIAHMEKGISEIETGNFRIRIQEEQSSDEMNHLISCFNDMMGQIESLKIQSYEDELERKGLEMDYMQLQIKPHFYLNAMNLINTMAQVGDTEMIRRLTENLSSYLRYISSTRNGVTTIREELAHIGNYLKIMELRFGENFSYEENVEDHILDLQIPPLTIQMIIENSMKYAFDIYGESKISLTVRSEERDVVILVMDNGEGYQQKIIDEFEGGTLTDGKHIGLRNIKKRLEYMYRERAQFTIKNRKPHGAVTEIRIRGGEE